MLTPLSRAPALISSSRISSRRSVGVALPWKTWVHIPCRIGVAVALDQGDPRALPAEEGRGGAAGDARADDRYVEFRVLGHQNLFALKFYRELAPCTVRRPKFRVMP